MFTGLTAIRAGEQKLVHICAEIWYTSVMRMETKEMRPYLKRLTDGEHNGELTVEWRPYEGPIPLWVFEYFNKRIDYYDHRERAKDDSPYDIMDCYQQALEEMAIEKIFLQAASGKTPKGKPIRNQKSYIKGSIYNLFMDYFNEINRAKNYISLDVEQHSSLAITHDKAYDEQNKDSSTVMDRTLAMLTDHERKLLEQVKMGKTSAEAAEDLGMPRQTYEWKLNQAYWHFLGGLGLEKVRHLVHDETALKFLDALIASKSDIASAAKILHMTRNDCRDAFKVILLPALLKACGGHNKILEHCL